MAVIKRGSVKKNYIFNLFYQIVILVVPLVTMPYVSRILGAEGVGAYSYAYSLNQYFVLFATFGFNYYAQREIAKHQDDNILQVKVFLEILVLRFLFVAIAIVINVGLLFAGTFGNYTMLMWILTGNIVSVAIDITYFFQGNEDFASIVIRNTLVKVVGVVLIFVFINTADDLILYAIILTTTQIGGNLIMWFKIPPFLKRRDKAYNLDIKRHLKPSLRLFVPALATTIYLMLDKTLIGVITGSDSQVGFYENAEKISKVCLMVLTALGTVMLPKMANLFAKEDHETINENIYKSFTFVYFLGFPILFGLIATAGNLIPWFLGEEFEPSIQLLMLLSVLIIPIGMSNVLGVQYFIPTGRDKHFTISLLSGATVNLVLNVVLIFSLGAVGAAIASIVAESTVTGVQLFFARKVFSVKKILLMSIKYLILGAIMFAGVFFTARVLDPSPLNTCILIIEGVGIYFIELLVVKDKYVFSLFAKIFHRKENINE